MIQVGVIGYGYWGPNIVRNFAEADGCHLNAVSDLNPTRLALAQRRYPGISITTDPRELIGNPAVDLVAISTPVATHYDLAMAALRAGKHVLVEKPLTMRADDARRLIDEAARRKLTLMVDHTFVYHGAVRKMKEIVSAGDLGELYYFDSMRVNLGLFQQDVDVLWDLAVHDISILQYVYPEVPRAVAATGMAHIPGRMEDIAYLTVFYDKNFIGHIHANWLAPVKTRRTTVGGSRKMIFYDDVEQVEKIKVYDKGVFLHQSPDALYQAPGYRTGDMHAPKIDTTEALMVEVRHLVDCISTGRQPVTDGIAGLRVVELLEAASRSMKNRGELVELPAAAAVRA
jgi:predicted dehydrogenase